MQNTRHALGNIEREKQYVMTEEQLARAVEEAEEEERKARLEEKARKGKLGEEEKTEEETSTSIILASILNPADYIKIPGKGLHGKEAVISKYELQGFNNLNYDETHFKLFENGLYMPTPALFMPHFVNVIKAYKGKTKLYDGNGNEISRKEIEDIYAHLTKDHTVYKEGSKGAWAWLNARFVEGKGFLDLDLETTIGIGKNKKLITKISQLEECLNENCYANLKFNSQGFATEKSNIVNNKGEQIYKQGENIYFWIPVTGAVAGFFADSGRVGFPCNWGPDDRGASLGVFGCAEGAAKNLGVGEK